MLKSIFCELFLVDDSQEFSWEVYLVDEFKDPIDCIIMDGPARNLFLDLAKYYWVYNCPTDFDCWSDLLIRLYS